MILIKHIYLSVYIYMYIYIYIYMYIHIYIYVYTYVYKKVYNDNHLVPQQPQGCRTTSHGRPHTKTSTKVSAPPKWCSFRVGFLPWEEDNIYSMCNNILMIHYTYVCIPLCIPLFKLTNIYIYIDRLRTRCDCLWETTETVGFRNFWMNLELIIPDSW